MFFTPVALRSPGHESSHRWPAPLSRKIDLWLWISMASSVAIILILQFSTSYSNSPLSIEPGPFGFAIFVVIIFYDTTLLILSSKERNITASVAVGWQMDAERVEEVEGAAQMRRTINFWILAVCQSGMAALGLYVGSRLTLLLWAPVQGFHNPIRECVEFAFSLGEMGILTYIAARCIVRDTVGAIILSSNNV
ncbi:hypothetical protein GALMADRAFT_245438 [Galerina marginata CBS 339.88]|uniref:Uncharacterized protein n=1 Tax=Galerina marginata (strain CBS 339.88) TaxID=685588 RepID=A0A067TEJ8_GALM3|nr:hypothetical protein GALMADRAFT_245438 [Galerina marginata CBS 339.88]